MANKKISELPSATVPLDGTELLEIVQGGINKKVAKDDVSTGSGGAWGTITGTLSDQTDLNTALGLKAPLASPALTGTPTAPTAAAGTNTTQVANTAFVQQEITTNKFSQFYIVSTIGALQTYLAGLGAGVDVNIWFPAGTYSVSSSITITNKGRVKIWGEGAVLVDAFAGAGDMFDVTTVTELWMKGLKFDFDLNANANDGIHMTAVAGVSRVQNCDFFDFGTKGHVAIRLNNTPANSLAGSLNYPFPGIELISCNFYNEITGTSYNYNSNNSNGVGVFAVENSEYGKVSSCGFNNINTAIWLRNGANWEIDHSTFLGCNSNGAGATGVIFFDNNSVINGGKLVITDSKFNHNWSYSIWSEYDQVAAARPISVDRCEFIANAITPIVFFGAQQPNNTVTNCFFDRANVHTTGTNDPYAAVTERYIYCLGNANLISDNIFLAGVNGSAIIGAGTSNFNIIKDNIYASTIALTAFAGGSTSNLVSGNMISNAAINWSTGAWQTDNVTIPSYSAVGFSPALNAGTNIRVGVHSTSTGGGNITAFSSNSAAANALFIRALLGATSPSASGVVLTVAKHNGTTNFTDIAATEIAYQFRNNATTFLEMLGSGRCGFGLSTPTARIHLAAGTATASTAPLKFSSGTILSTPETGVVEYDGTNFHVTNSSTRFVLAKTLTNTAALNFGSIASLATEILTITVTGAADGDPVVLGVPNASMTAGLVFTAWVSASNTVSVQCYNSTAGAIDPASATFRVSVLRY